MSERKISEVLRLAAQYLENTGIHDVEFACLAIRIVVCGPASCCDPDELREVQFFADYFKPENFSTDSTWFDSEDDDRDAELAHRILSLCLAAAVAESEGK